MEDFLVLGQVLQSPDLDVVMKATNPVALMKKGVAFQEDDWSVKDPPYFHEWSCGCKTRITKDAFEIVPCKEDCDLFLVAMGQKEPEPLNCEGANHG